MASDAKTAGEEDGGGPEGSAAGVPTLPAFVKAGPAQVVSMLARPDGSVAEAVAGWLRAVVGATSATREQMEPQEALLAALDEAAVWQQRRARVLAATDPVAEGTPTEGGDARPEVYLPWRADTVLAALLRGGGAGFAAVVALCAGPADCVRWRALSLLLHCRCADGEALARAEGVPFLAPDALACSPRVHHLSDKVYTQLYDVDAWIGPMAAAGMTPASELLPLSLRELRAVEAACEAVNACPKRDDLDAALVWAYVTERVSAPTCLSEPSALGDDARAALASLASRVDAAMTRLHCRRGTAGMCESASAFVKLSTRSPKDSTLFQARAASATGLDAECEGSPMRVDSGAEALALLVTSERVRADVHEAVLLAQARGRGGVPRGVAVAKGSRREVDDVTTGGDAAGVASGAMSLVVREWWHLPRWTEMRGFVRRRRVGAPARLMALSQYLLDTDGTAAPGTTAAPPALARSARSLGAHAAAVCDAVRAFVSVRLDPLLLLPEVGIDHAVVDFALRERTDGARASDTSDARDPSDTPGWLRLPAAGPGDGGTAAYEVVVLELNSFGFRSDGALYDWSDEADANILFEGPGGGSDDTHGRWL